MTDEQHEKCENEDCDKCDPRPRWIVSQHRIEHVTHQREIKAATREEALAIYEQGTAWPSSYDDRSGEVLQFDPVEIVAMHEAPDKHGRYAHTLKYHREDCCWNDPKRKAEMAEFLSRGDDPDDEFAETRAVEKLEPENPS